MVVIIHLGKVYTCQPCRVDFVVVVVFVVLFVCLFLGGWF